MNIGYTFSVNSYFFYFFLNFWPTSVNGPLLATEKKNLTTKELKETLEIGNLN